MVFINYLKDCHTASEDTDGNVTANKPDIGFYEGSAKYLAIPHSDDFDTIYDNTFNGCTALEELYIPSNVSIIEAKAFAGCPSLKLVTLCRSKPSTSMTKRTPFGAPATCKFVYDKKAKPKT